MSLFRGQRRRGVVLLEQSIRAALLKERARSKGTRSRGFKDSYAQIEVPMQRVQREPWLEVMHM